MPKRNKSKQKRMSKVWYCPAPCNAENSIGRYACKFCGKFRGQK